MSPFPLADVLDAIAPHVEREYPREACGLVLERGGAWVVVPLSNRQDELHALDPRAFPRTARDAFAVDDRERRAALADGGIERVLYHSHVDCDAYLSAEDRRLAVDGGVEALPGVLHLVLSVRRGRLVDHALYAYDEDRFVELARGRAGGVETSPRAAGTIAPHGGALHLPRIGPVRGQAALATVEERVEIDADGVELLERLGDGLFSPLARLLDEAERAAIDRTLPSGLTYRRPPALIVREAAVGRRLGLVHAGRAIAIVDVVGRTPVPGGFAIAGPVALVTPERGPGWSALETRAELARRGLVRVAAGRRVDLAEAERLLAAFDGLLAAELPPELAADRRCLLAPPLSTPGFFGALFAQNLGASVFPGIAEADRAGLAIAGDGKP